MATKIFCDCCGEQMSAKIEWWTLPALGQKEALRLIVMGDSPVRKSSAAKRMWQDPTYRDEQHQRRVNDSKQRFAGAFCTDPLDEPTLEEFDTWEYGGALNFNTNAEV